MQVQGVDFDETWSPVANITAAFVHAHLKPTKTVYIPQPPGFACPGNYILRLKNKVCVNQTSIHASSLIGDLLFYACDDKDINLLLVALKANDICIHCKGAAEGFLSGDISRTYASPGSKPTVILTQRSLTTCIIEALELCTSYTTKQDTPTNISPLNKNDWILLCLSRHSRPDIAFTVHRCTCYTFAPTALHEQSLKCTGQYLKEDLFVDRYSDADFAGLYGYNDLQDPHHACSCTGYLINVFGCPVLWLSKLQIKIALSTMEAKYMALRPSCKDLFPIINLVVELS
ncbi:hypothetical protein ACHAW6_003283 [Cyclotella cf. meneghiniana]